MPEQYSLIDLGFLPGGIWSVPMSVSDSGGICGWSATQSGGGQAFVWHMGTGMSSIGNLQGTRQEANGINFVGQVCGMQVTPDGHAHAFRWTPSLPNGTFGTYEQLVGLGDIQWVGNGRAINRLGHVVGQAWGDYSVGDAALWPDPSSIQQLGTHSPDPGYFSWATAVNDHGNIAVVDEVNGAQTPALWAPIAPGGITGALHPIGANAGILSGQARGISLRGAVCGYFSRDPLGPTHAFRWTPTTPNGVDGNLVDLGSLPGTSHSEANAISSMSVVGTSGGRAFIHYGSGGMQDLNDLIAPNSGWKLLVATGINRHGWIVGYGSYQGGYQWRGFLLIPSLRHRPIHLGALVWAILGGVVDDSGGIRINPFGPRGPEPVPPWTGTVSPAIADVLRLLVSSELVKALQSERTSGQARIAALEAAAQRLRQIVETLSIDSAGE